jgi:hypothetical protein
MTQKTQISLENMRDFILQVMQENPVGNNKFDLEQKLETIEYYIATGTKILNNLND